MRHDDAPVGRLLSRRQVVTLLGSTGAAWIAAGVVVPRVGAAAGAPSCVVRPEQTEGPYFVDERLNRSDIRSDPADGEIKAGTPLALTMLVSRLAAGSCRPLAGAIVDIWHCDARGIYSDVEDASFNTVGQKFLRGYQVTNAGGEVQFLTIYPGRYPRRTTHIHFKIRTESARSGFEFTSQLYFDDAMTDRVHAAAAYAESRDHVTRNVEDRIFRRGGEQLTLDPTATEAGYAASFAVALELS